MTLNKLAFNGLINLERQYLRFNYLDLVENGVFYKLTNLLKVIDKLEFTGSVSLNDFNFKSNTIESIDAKLVFCLLILAKLNICENSATENMISEAGGCDEISQLKKVGPQLIMEEF